MLTWTDFLVLWGCAVLGYGIGVGLCLVLEHRRRDPWHRCMPTRSRYLRQRAVSNWRITRGTPWWEF